MLAGCAAGGGEWSIADHGPTLGGERRWRVTFSTTVRARVINRLSTGSGGPENRYKPQTFPGRGGETFKKFSAPGPVESRARWGSGGSDRLVKGGRTRGDGALRLGSRRRRPIRFRENWRAGTAQGEGRWLGSSGLCGAWRNRALGRFPSRPPLHWRGRLSPPPGATQL